MRIRSVPTVLLFAACLIAAAAGPWSKSSEAQSAKPPAAAGPREDLPVPDPDGPDSGDAAPVAGNQAEANLPLVLEVWKRRVARNHGVHPWNRRHDGMRVWQEWIALLTTAKSAPPEARRRMGQALEKYVVGGDIKPLGFNGTSLPVPGYDQGDFDMSLLGCSSLLGLFRNDRDLLTDTTLVHLLKNVARTWGQTPKAYFDVMFMSVPETENHLFMTESTRYLNNQLIWENSRRLPQLAALRDSLQRSGVVIDNSEGMLKRLLLKVMQKAMRKGFFEFNAQIYQRFTVHALDNLYTFARDPAVADGAGCLLDYLSTIFAFQSFDGIRYGPFRRSSEVYDDSSLIGNDAVCSFFGLQSGATAGQPDPSRGLWRTHTAHSSMALYSAVLGYRVPDPILRYMQDRPGEYRAEIRSAYAGDGSRRRPTEVYYGTSEFMLTAGGRYESYAGPNFPTYGYLFRDAPWVYDVITRSGSLILDPRKDRPVRLRDILHFRGPQWRANNMSIQRNFLYGYAPVDAYNSPDWPQYVPKGWPTDGRTYATRDFEFRFYDRSDAGAYIILSRLRPGRTFLKWGYQKYLRGGIEVVDTAKAGSLKEVVDRTLAHNSPKSRWPWGPHRYTYVNFEGAAFRLDSRYDGETDGILGVFAAKPWEDAKSYPAVTLPFPHEWMGGDPGEDTGPALAGFLGKPSQEPPLFQVDLYSPWQGKVALADGRGNMYVFNPATGGYCLSNFREWWNPRRKIHAPQSAR